MPSDFEEALMLQHMMEKGLDVIRPAGVGLPLITYFGSLSFSSDGARPKQQIRAACLALRHGIGPDDWRSRIFNLNPASEDYQALKAGGWAEAGNGGWNGVWIHQGHGVAGQVNANGMQGGRSFYDYAGQYVMTQEGFRHCLMKTCHAADAPQPGGSVIEAMAAAALEKHQIRPVIYGARSVTWVPVSGPHFGRPMISPMAVIAAVAAQAHQGDDGGGEIELSARELYQAAGELLAMTEEIFEQLLSDPIHGIDCAADFITPRFERLAAFDPADAEPLPRTAEGWDDLPDVGADIDWYGVNMAAVQ